MLEGWSRRVQVEVDDAAETKSTSESSSSSGVKNKSVDPSDYSLYADITFTDGSNKWAFVVPFGDYEDEQVTGQPDGGSGGSGDGSERDGDKWRHAYGVIDEDKAVQQITLVLMYRHREGAVMFDDVRLSPLREALCHLPLDDFTA